MPSSTPQHSSMPCSPHELARLEPLVPRVRGDDLREERPCRLEVVVVAVHATVGEAPAWSSSRMPALTATLRPDSLADQRHELEQALHRALVGAAHGEHDAELRRAQLGGLLGRARSTSSVSRNGRGLHLGLELRRLAAEVAVLGATAGLGREDALDLDLGTAPGQAHLVRQRRERRHGAAEAASRQLVERRCHGGRGVSPASVHRTGERTRAPSQLDRVGRVGRDHRGREDMSAYA